MASRTGVRIRPCLGVMRNRPYVGASSVSHFIESSTSPSLRPTSDRRLEERPRPPGQEFAVRLGRPSKVTPVATDRQWAARPLGSGAEGDMFGRYAGGGMSNTNGLSHVQPGRFA